MAVAVQSKAIGLFIFIVIQGRLSGMDVPVRKGESVVLLCGFETSDGNAYFKWEASQNDKTVELADNLSGEPVCNEQLISCDVYPDASIELHNVDEVDGARTYRCLRGGDGVFGYFSDHHLVVLPDDTTPEDETQASFEREMVHLAWFFAGDDGIIYAYRQPVCRNQGGMNLNVSCMPASGELVQEISQTIDCTCYDSSGEVDTVQLGVREYDCPATTCGVCWVVFIVAILLLLVVNAAAILGWFFYKRKDAINADNEKQESTPRSPKGDGDVRTDQEDESGKLLGGEIKKDDSQTDKRNSGVDLYELETQRGTPEGDTIAVQATDVLTEKNGESDAMKNGLAEKDWQEKYNHLDTIYKEYVTAISATLKQKDEKIEEFRKKYEEQKRKFQNLSLKYAQMSDKTFLRSTSSTDEPDDTSGGTVSLQGNVSEAYEIGEHRHDKKFHLTFSLERPGLKIVLSSCQVGKATKFELEFKDGKIGTVKFGEEQEYIQCSNGTVNFDLILDGCQLSLHEQSPDGVYPLMEHEHMKFNLCSFLNVIKLNNSCVFTILRHDKLTASHP